jgi:carbamate kinase
MRIVAAIGGRALLGRGETATLSTERDHLSHAVEALSGLAARGGLVVTYGADLQLLVPPESVHSAAMYPMDVLEAESEGLVGYLLEQSLQEALGDRQVVTMLTRVEVDPTDPEFLRPSQPTGPIVDTETAGLLAAANKWLMVRQGEGRRRAVASPEPRRVLESRAVEVLVASGVVVVCGGGGGIPVVRDRFGTYHGVDAVVEKDFTAALLARDVGADAFVLLTDAAGVWVDWGTPGAKLVRAASPEALRSLTLERASIGAKVEAACRYVEWTGREAFVGAVEHSVELLEGATGTRISGSVRGIELQDAVCLEPIHRTS